MNLSINQLNYFDTFGFLILKDFFSKKEIENISEKFDLAMSDQKTAESDDLLFNKSKLFMDENTPFLASLADEDRFVHAAEQLIRSSVIGVFISGSYYMGDTYWHTDNYHLEYKGAKFLIYLEELDATNGALRVLPGSHKDPLWRQSKLSHETEETFGITSEEMPAYCCSTRPGDVIVFQQSLWHAALNGKNYRRAIDINYYADPITKIELEAFKNQMKNNHGPSAALGKQLYSEYWKSIPNERHQRWISRLAELGQLETPVYPAGY